MPETELTIYFTERARENPQVCQALIDHMGIGAKNCELELVGTPAVTFERGGGLSGDTPLTAKFRLSGDNAWSDQMYGVLMETIVGFNNKPDARAQFFVSQGSPREDLHDPNAYEVDCTFV